MVDPSLQATVVATQFFINIIVLGGFIKSAYNGTIAKYASQLQKIESVDSRLGTVEQLLVFIADEEDERVVQVAVEQDELDEDVLSPDGQAGD